MAIELVSGTLPHASLLPGSRTEAESPIRIMTAFRHPNGVRYMQSFPPFREIRGPED